MRDLWRDLDDDLTAAQVDADEHPPPTRPQPQPTTLPLERIVTVRQDEAREARHGRTS